jgi:hypothetical protein
LVCNHGSQKIYIKKLNYWPQNGQFFVDGNHQFFKVFEITGNPRFFKDSTNQHQHWGTVMSGNLGAALAGYVVWKRLCQFFYRNRNAHCGGHSIFQNVPKLFIYLFIFKIQVFTLRKALGCGLFTRTKAHANLTLHMFLALRTEWACCKHILAP